MFTQFIVLPLAKFSVPKVAQTNQLPAVPVEATALFITIRKLVLLMVRTSEVLIFSYHIALSSSV